MLFPLPPTVSHSWQCIRTASACSHSTLLHTWRPTTQRGFWALALHQINQQMFKMHWKPETAWFSKLLCFQLPGASFFLVSCWFLSKIRPLTKSYQDQRALAILQLHPRPPFLLFFLSPFLQQKHPMVLIHWTAMFSFVHCPEKRQHSAVKACRTNPSNGVCRYKSKGA